MNQNLIHLVLPAETMAEVDAALTILETRLYALQGLDPQTRRTLNKMGDKSEAFCRDAVVAFVQNGEVLPRNFDIGGYVDDLNALDALRPVRMRMTKLYERMLDTEMALGSDLMVNSLKGYACLKVAGKGAGLDALRRMLAARFARGRRGGTVEETEEGE